MKLIVDFHASYTLTVRFVFLSSTVPRIRIPPMSNNSLIRALADW